MNTGRRMNCSRAFTVVELLAMVVMVFLVVLVFLPDGPLIRARGCRLKYDCVNNLKQVALAFRLWSGDNGDMYPMRALAKKEYGSFEFNATNSFRYFQVASNELCTPKVVICPQDAGRTAATDFTTDFDNRRISYFVDLDADETMPQKFLAGDWNLTNGQPKANGILFLQTNQCAFWTKDLHNKMGNVAFADGSVQQLNNHQINAVLAKTGQATNRLLFP